MHTERELRIDSYIEQHPDAKQAGVLPILYHGGFREHEVYRLPTNLLVFNIGNGRFAAELMAEQKKADRDLDPTKPEDAKIVQRLLLDQNAEETKALKESLRRNGQIEAGIITFDGAVINANRRMAILQQLAEETGDERFEFLKVARLPKGVGIKDLWKIEAKLQFGRDFRLQYGPVNELLKIRAGRHSGLSEKQISEALMGRYSEKQVRERLEVLKLIDSYLDAIGKPGEYTTIQEERVVEMFNSLHNSVVSPLRKTAEKLEVPKITEIGFAMIKSGKHSHWDVRKLRSVAELPQARATVYKLFNKKGDLDTDAGKVKDAFDKAVVIVDAQKEKDRPEKLADEALSVLKEIDSHHPSVRKAEFQRLINEIGSEVRRLTKGPAIKREKTRH